MSVTLTKLLLRLRKLGELPEAEVHRVFAKHMLAVAAILRLGENPLMQHPIDDDSGALSISLPAFICPSRPQYHMHHAAAGCLHCIVRLIYTGCHEAIQSLDALQLLHRLPNYICCLFKRMNDQQALC